MEPALPAPFPEEPARSREQEPGHRFKDALQRHDPGLAVRILRSVSRPLRRHVELRYGRRLGGPCGVDELVSEAIEKVLMNGTQYNPFKGPLGFWLWRVGDRLARDVVRSERLRKDREHEAASFVRGDNASALIRDFVLEAIESIQEPYRTILGVDLEFGGRAPAAQLTERLGLGIQTLYNLRRQARTILAEKLRPEST